MPKLYSKEKLSIKRLRHLSYRLGYPVDLLKTVAENATKYYIFWPKRKPNGGLRNLSKVKQPLSNIQQSIHTLLQELSLPKCVHGGVKERSNYTNALVHCKNDQLFNLDLKNYFPSISHHRVYGLFRNELDCSPDVARLLTKLCTVNGMVPQGASMSTDIANLVFRRTDYRLEGYAESNNKHYTRFMDDISHSGKAFTRTQIQNIKSIVKDSGFNLNPDKEELRGRHEQQVVTGLTVKYRKPRITRAKKREWRQEIFKFTKYEKAILNDSERDKKIQKINGWSNYIDMIERGSNPT